MSHRLQGTTVKARHSELLLFLIHSVKLLSHSRLWLLLSAHTFAGWGSMITLDIYICFILCVFRRNTEGEAGS